MKNFYAALIFSLYIFNASAQTAANTWSVRFSDTIIKRYQPTIDAMTGKGWEYSNGIILCGIEKVYEQVNTATYLNYIKTYVDTYVNSSGQLLSSNIMTTLGLDGAHPGILCILLYQQTSLTKYKTAAKAIRDTLMTASIGYPRTPQGGFWHRNDAANFKNVELLDGIYMAQPFLAKYGAVFNDPIAIDTAVNQTITLYNDLYSPATHLINHAFDYDKNTYPWAAPATGISKQVWSRGMGWFVMSIVEILRFMPKAHPKFGQMVNMLDSLAVGLKNRQDAAGLWYDVVDSAGTAPQNYIETSGSGMFIFALKTAIDSGWVNSVTYLPVVNKAWTQYKTYITTYPGPSINGISGGPQITSFCPAMGVQNNYAAYVGNRPVNVPTSSGTGKQHPHGYAATLFAASAMEFPLVTTPVRFSSFIARRYAQYISLSWHNDDDTEVDHYEIQKSNNQSGFIMIGSVKSNGTGQYSWADNDIKGNDVFYRIKAVSMSGAIHYTEIIHLDLRSSKSELRISPNPVKNGEVNLFLNNFKAGSYTLKIFNTSGSKMVEKKLDVYPGNSVFVISLPFASGLYHVQLIGEGEIINSKILKL